MRTKPLLLIAALVVSVLGFYVLAQDDAEQATVQVMQSEQHGEYLTDGEGRTLYLFVNEGEEPEEAYDSPMSEGVRESAAACSEECLSAWPAFTAEGEIAAGEAVDPELLYTASVDGRGQVVYNGWPLFYFSQDAEPGQINGHRVESFGGVWYILGPDGWRVEQTEEGM